MTDRISRPGTPRLQDALTATDFEKPGDQRGSDARIELASTPLQIHVVADFVEVGAAHAAAATAPESDEPVVRRIEVEAPRALAVQRSESESSGLIATQVESAGGERSPEDASPGTRPDQPVNISDSKRGQASGNSAYSGDHTIDVLEPTPSGEGPAPDGRPAVHRPAVHRQMPLEPGPARPRPAAQEATSILTDASSKLRAGLGAAAFAVGREGLSQAIAGAAGTVVKAGTTTLLATAGTAAVINGVPVVGLAAAAVLTSASAFMEVPRLYHSSARMVKAMALDGTLGPPGHGLNTPARMKMLACIPPVLTVGSAIYAGGRTGNIFAGVDNLIRSMVRLGVVNPIRDFVSHDLLRGVGPTVRMSPAVEGDPADVAKAKQRAEAVKAGAATLVRTGVGAGTEFARMALGDTAPADSKGELPYHPRPGGGDRWQAEFHAEGVLAGTGAVSAGLQAGASHFLSAATAAASGVDLQVTEGGGWRQLRLNLEEILSTTATFSGVALEPTLGRRIGAAWMAHVQSHDDPRNVLGVAQDISFALVDGAADGQSGVPPSDEVMAMRMLRGFATALMEYRGHLAEQFERVQDGMQDARNAAARRRQEAMRGAEFLAPLPEESEVAPSDFEVDAARLDLVAQASQLNSVAVTMESVVREAARFLGNGSRSGASVDQPLAPEVVSGVRVLAADQDVPRDSASQPGNPEPDEMV